MTKITHDLVQGSADWQEYRLKMFGASEAAAMLGLSPNVTRTELLHMKHTCTPQEFSDWVRINILDYGHVVEAMSRPLAEDIVGTELYPVTCSIGKLSASCDGLTMAEDVAFEHKQWNEALAASVEANVLPDEYQPQCQQIMMVTGAEMVLFVVSSGTRDTLRSMWVFPDADWQERIRAGWDQFEADLAVYEPKNFAPKPSAEPIMALPALVIQIRGEVTLSNLPAFRHKAEAFISSIKTELKTDEDFVQADATVKFCKDAEERLEHAKVSAIGQTASIDELMRTVDHISAQLREKRLMLEKLVETQKKSIKDAILATAKQSFSYHVAALEQEIEPIRLVYQTRDFVGAMKNKRTLVSLHNAADTELAAGKIVVDALAKAVRARLTWYKEVAAGSEQLFADLQGLIQKPDDDFKLVVNTRIAEHKAKEAEKVAAELVRIQAEEQARVDRETKLAVPEVAAFDASTSGDSANSIEERPLGVLAPAASWPFPKERAEVDPPTVLNPAAAWPPKAPSLRLGQIAERLGFALTAEFLRGLGFEPAARDKAACLYHDEDFEHICRALIRHINSIQLQAA